MKRSILLACAIACASITNAGEVPSLIQHDIPRASEILASKQDSMELWPDLLPLDRTLRSPKAIHSIEDLRAVLATAPKTFNKGLSFQDIVEFDGWFAASLDAPDTKPGQSMWVLVVMVQKGSSKLCCFSHW